MESPVWHIHNGEPPKPGTKLSFGMLLNLASVCNTEDRAVLWGFITRYAPAATPQGERFLNTMVGLALRYDQDLEHQAKRSRVHGERRRTEPPDQAERAH